MVVLGQQRLTGGLVGLAQRRGARRGMALAAELRLPLVLVIDTAGPTNPPVRRCWPSTTTGWPARSPSV
ncbi:hypothetical protein MAHJHV57_54770 [Mycobacterium avium subsp. hominissuis]